MAYSAGGSAPQRVQAAAVRAAFFPSGVLVARPLLGRTFAPGEYAKPDANSVVVLNHRLWQQRYGARPQVIGHTIRLDGRYTTVMRCRRTST